MPCDPFRPFFAARVESRAEEAWKPRHQCGSECYKPESIPRRRVTEGLVPEGGLPRIQVT
jgi:hypothetical protein